MVQKPLLIFDLEGTLGEIFLKKDTGSHPPFMFLRPKLFDGLNDLRQSSNNYMIALATSINSEELSYFTEYLKKQGFEFDGLYDGTLTSANPPKSSTIIHFKDLSRVYDDFRISPEELSDRVLVIEDLQLSDDEIFVGEKIFKSLDREVTISQKAQDLIYKDGAYNTYGNPLPKNGYTPTVLLVPNPRLSYYKSMPMGEIISLINATYESGQGSFGNGFCELNRDDVLKLETDVLRIDPRIFSFGAGAENNSFVKAVTSDFKQKYLILVPGDKPTLPYEKVII